MNLAALMVEPAWRMRQVGTEAGLVNDQDRGIHDAVGQSSLREHAIALGSVQSQQAIGSGNLLQELNDDPAVVDCASILQNKTRHLAERILLTQRISLVERVCRGLRNPVVQPQGID